MKRIIFLVCLIEILGDSTIAQKIRFTDRTNSWTFVTSTTVSPAPFFVYNFSYDKDTFINSIKYNKIESILVREDTTAGKLYFRFKFINIQADTNERLLFDYNLSVGDTFRVRDFRNEDYANVVSEIDSVSVDGVFHRTWKMKAIPTTNQTGQGCDYLFIEGVGTEYGPRKSATPYGCGDLCSQLRCFTTQGIRPKFSPAISLPCYDLPYYHFAPAKFFDNQSSCQLYTANIKSTAETRDIQIVPNPGGRQSVLVLPEYLSEVSLNIVDVLGRLVVSRDFSGQRKIHLGELLQSNGAHRVLLTDKITGSSYRTMFWFVD